jgi:hypothetical protein
VTTQGIDLEVALTKVRCRVSKEPLSACQVQERPKLLICNIHETLLDYSLIAERNPNSSIRYTWKTKTHRVVYRPWIKEFLWRCFKNFEVTFWDRKSDTYLAKVVPVLMGTLTTKKGMKPYFVWSSKQCAAIEYDDGAPTAWDKPLEKVFE